jgi:hypothetical protein
VRIVIAESGSAARATFSGGGSLSSRPQADVAAPSATSALSRIRVRGGAAAFARELAFFRP